MSAPGGTFDNMPLSLSRGVAENLARILHTVRTHLRMDTAFVSQFLGEERVLLSVSSDSAAVLGLQGGLIPVANSYCQHIVEGRLPPLIPDTGMLDLARSIPGTQSIPIGAHIGIPIMLETGEFFGTLCCFSHEPNRSLNDRDLQLVSALGRVVANEIAVDIEGYNLRRSKFRLIDDAIRAGSPNIAFQPIVGLGDLSISGVECLARFFVEPARPPDQWFADAHSIGMGGTLELMAMERGLELSRALPRDWSVSVNVSPPVLVATNVLPSLAGVDPHRVIVEITEHVRIEDYAPVLLALRPLREAGIRIAIDDAGAGFSTLSHILAIQPDVIKLDLSLTRGVDRDPGKRAMTAALSEFARRTRTVLVAEGVETRAELEALRELGVDKAQGYYFDRPLPLSELIGSLRTAEPSRLDYMDRI